MAGYQQGATSMLNEIEVDGNSRKDEVFVLLCFCKWNDFLSSLMEMTSDANVKKKFKESDESDANESVLCTCVLTICESLLNVDV